MRKGGQFNAAVILETVCASRLDVLQVKLTAGGGGGGALRISF